jgi:virulence factor Mce-like protein
VSTGHAQRLRLIGAAFIAVVLVLTVVIFAGVQRKPFEASTHKVVVEFEKAAQLHPGDQVRLEGDINGKVEKIEQSPTPENARVTLRVDEDAGPIYADARARLREKTLLGGAFYVDIDRGTKGAGPLGDKIIGTSRTSVQTEIEDITDVFRQDAVTGLQTLPKEFGKALANPAPPVKVLQTANTIAPDAAKAVYALRGQQPGKDLPRLVHSTSRAVKALDTPTDDIRTVVAGAAATLQTTGRRSAELRETIAAGPGATYDMAHTLARLDGTLDVARGLIHRLDRSAPLVAPTFKELNPTLSLADDTLRKNTPLIAEIGNTARAGGQLGTQLDPILTGAKPTFTRADDTILPYLGRKDPVDGYSTTVMVGGFLAGFGGVTTMQDQLGHYVRFPASLGTDSPSLYLPCSSSIVDPNAASQLACDTLNTALKTYLSYFPPPVGSGAKKTGGRNR